MADKKNEPKAPAPVEPRSNDRSLSPDERLAAMAEEQAEMHKHPTGSYPL